MVKCTTTGADGIIRISLGLEPGNITRLQAGQPILVRLSDLGFVGAVGAVQLMIFTGPSKDEMLKAIAPFIGPETVIIHS